MSKEKEILHIYIRVSTTNQEELGTSLKHQEKVGIKKAKDLGMNYEIHNELSASSSLEGFTNRPIFTRLLRMVEDGEVKNVFVYNTDRLSRNTINWGIIRERFKNKDVKIFTENGKIDLNNKIENLTFGILTEFAVYENELRRERLIEGRKERAKNGYWWGGEVAFGYKKEDRKNNKNYGKIVKDSEQSEWVKRIYDWYDEGVSLKEIKRRLDGNVLTNRGEVLWNSGSVLSLMSNTIHKGIYTVYNTQLPSPKIVDEELWERVNKKIQSNKRIVRGNGLKIYNFPLKPILYCGDCGNEMGGRSNKLKSGERKSNYLCKSFNKEIHKRSEKGDWVRNKYCKNNVSMECERLEDGIWFNLISILKTSHKLKEEFKKERLKVKYDSNKTKQSNLKILKKKRKKVIEGIDGLEELVVKKEIELEVKSNNKKLIKTKIKLIKDEIDKERLKLIQLENEIGNLENDNLWIDWVNDYEELIKETELMKREDRIEVIKKYIKRIDVYFDKESRKHTFNLTFKLKLINDVLEYKNIDRKSLGYMVKDGSKDKVLELDLGIRNIR